MTSIVAAIVKRSGNFVFHCFQHDMSSRNRAFFWHLLASALVGVCSLTLVFFVWYPAPLHKAVGVTEIFLIVLAVDIIVGPCLTWTVARPGKRRRMLILDLSIIICTQCAALVYGLSTVAEGRPSWLVLNVDRVNLVRAFEVDTRHLDRAKPEYRQVPWGRPQWVFAEMPVNKEELNTLTFESVMGGTDLYQRPEYFRPITDPARMPIIQNKAEPLEKLEKFNPPETVAVQLAAYPEADAWMPIVCNVQAMVVLLEKKNGRILGIVELNPWY